MMLLVVSADRQAGGPCHYLTGGVHVQNVSGAARRPLLNIESLLLSPA